MAKVQKTVSKSENVLTINTSLINKDEVFKMLALAHSTGMPLLLIGDPGVGKTKVVIDYAKAWLMDKVDKTDPIKVAEAQQKFAEKIYILETDEGTKSSEVKGMPDLEKLFTDNKYELSAPITEADIVVVNEIDKASSNIRNSLLGVMNEKFLFNGKHKVPCKWKLFIGTCNSIPKDEVNSPFWDRFILKYKVNRISAGDIISYYDKGGKDFKQELDLVVPSKEDLDAVTVSTNKLEKYVDIAYNHSSDRTLTFVPTLTRAISHVWETSVDKALVKVASLMLGTAQASELQAKLMNPEVKALMSKVDMIWSLNTEEEIQTNMAEIESLMKNYAKSGKIDESQVMEIEQSIHYVLNEHPTRKKAAEIDEILGDAQVVDVDALGGMAGTYSINPIGTMPSNTSGILRGQVLDIADQSF